jgi:hypothetical protein
MVAERKLRHRQLNEDGNIEITGRDLRGRDLLRRQLWSTTASVIAGYR